MGDDQSIIETINYNHSQIRLIKRRKSMEKLYSIKEAASLLSISPKTVQRWLLERRLRGVKLGGKIWRIAESALAQLIRRSPTNEEKIVEVEEERVWLEANLDRLNDYGTYDWEPGELEEGDPVHFVPGKGFVVEERQRGVKKGKNR